MAKRRVVITGMGVMTPLGHTVDQYWAGLISGQSGIGPLTLFDASQYTSRIAGECREFNIEQWVEDGRAAKRMDRFAQFALASAVQAVKDSGLDMAAEDPYRVGVIVGSGIGGIMELQTPHQRLRDNGPSKSSAVTIPKLMLNAASGNISIHFGTRGPSTAVAPACASATNAMGAAYRSIQRGETEIMITGGSEAAVVEISVAAVSAMHAWSPRKEEPARASRPFDKDRDGFVISEGAGVLVFEELERAQKRGARIYAEVLGYGMSSDGGHIAQPDETGAGAAAAMRSCLADARIGPEGLDYINAHGTGTMLGDIAETKAIKQVFGKQAYEIPVSSTKSATGHLLGASGGVELVATVMALHTGILPPTINLDAPDPECDLDYVANQSRRVDPRMAMSNSFGFGGHNACILVGKPG